MKGFGGEGFRVEARAARVFFFGVSDFLCSILGFRAFGCI